MAFSTKERLQRRLCYLCLLVVACQLVIGAASPSWWSLGVSPISVSKCTEEEPCPTCPELGNSSLTDTQVILCSNAQEPVRAIARGARKAIINCQYQFSNSSWNCSTFGGDNVFGSFVNDGTRETAVLYAYLTAGAALGIAKACHTQEIEGCCTMLDTPGKDEDGNLIYYGCNDNIEWALGYITTFTVVPVSSPVSAMELTNEHNANVGKEAMKRDHGRTCNCHGVSGTCSVQTCYDRVPDFSEVGERFFAKYQGAIKVVKSEEEEEKLVPVRPDAVPPEYDDLVYTGDSPSFCTTQLEKGVIGSAGRLCSTDLNSNNRCDVLCCDRGHHTTRYEVPREKCEFIWCCRIECEDDGVDIVDVTRCN